MDNLIAFAGYGMQYLRAFPWFREWMTFLIVFALAVVGTQYLSAVPHETAQALVEDVLSNFLKIMGGLGITMIVSHSGLAPKYNAFGTGEQKS